ncbi:MAG: substrate-binding domain-containing protein [Pseudomonadota bacterium]
MNLKQLSELLELSPTTVSRALNGYPEVNAETRARVKAAAARHGYAPNTMARRLATGRTMGIGHVVPLGEHDMINPIFADFMAGAGEAYSATGYNMILSVVPAENELETYRAMAASQNVDGVIVHAPLVDDRRIECLDTLGLPYIVHGRTREETGYSWLDIRNRDAFYGATARLTALGHRRIALLNGLPGMMFALRRREGYEAALTDIGAGVDPGLVRGADMTEPYGYAAAHALLTEADRPTAFLTSSLMVALGVNRAVAELGLQLGRDISVITHDDALSFLPNGSDVPLFAATKSSVRMAGKRAAEMLIDLIEGRAAGPLTELWDVPLVDGPSLGPGPEA